MNSDSPDSFRLFLSVSKFHILRVSLSETSVAPPPLPTVSGWGGYSRCRLADFRQLDVLQEGCKNWREDRGGHAEQQRGLSCCSTAAAAQTKPDAPPVEKTFF